MVSDVGPNITGQAGQFPSDAGYISGALKVVKGSVSSDTVNGTPRWSTLYLNAEDFSSIYGNGTTVQPKSIMMLACIKI